MRGLSHGPAPAGISFSRTFVSGCVLVTAFLLLGSCSRRGEVVYRPSAELACDCVDSEEPEVETSEDYGRTAWSERAMVSTAQLTAADLQSMALDESGVMALKSSHDVFFGNLHSHTSYSDGSAKPEQAFPHARSIAELDFLALTEHNHRSAPNGANGIASKHELYDGPGSNALINVAGDMTEDGAFVALYGQEFSSIGTGNHLNVLDVPHVIDDQEVANGFFRALLKTWLPDNVDSTDQPAVLQMNHPWNSNSPSAKEYGRDDFEPFSDPFDEWRTSLDRHAQLIEIINGPSHDDGTGHDPKTISDSEYRRYLNLGFHLAPSANQDNHFENWGSSTDARTAVVATALTKNGVLEALRSRSVYATLDKNLRIFSTVEGEPTGSILAAVPDNDEPLRVEISIDDDDEPEATYFVEVFADSIGGEGNGQRARLVGTYGPLETGAAPGEINVWVLEDLLFDSDWDYVYLMVLQKEDGEDEPVQQAWLAPVWFEPVS